MSEPQISVVLWVLGGGNEIGKARNLPCGSGTLRGPVGGEVPLRSNPQKTVTFGPMWRRPVSENLSGTLSLALPSRNRAVQYSALEPAAGAFQAVLIVRAGHRAGNLLDQVACHPDLLATARQVIVTSR